MAYPDTSPQQVSMVSEPGPSRPTMAIQISIPRTEERSAMGGLKSYTAYFIQINDFGTTYSVERRFDDFQRLHQDLLVIDGSLPSLPEKKMWASTDASVVAERRPAFETLLNYCLRSEDIAFDSNQFFWKFIDMPLPGIVAARYLFRKRRVGGTRQVLKLLDDKYSKEHAYRICHEAIVTANLQLLSSDGLLTTNRSPSTLANSPPGEDGGAKGAASPANASPEATAPNESDLEGGVFEMLRYAMMHGGEVSKKRFLEDDGIKCILDVIRRSSTRPDAGSIPNQRARNVLSALIQSDGDRFPGTFASFLRRGGVGVLSSFRELCSKHGAYAEFIAKLLWLAWDADTQAAFLQADNSGAEALSLLSTLFASGTKSGQIMAGLLLSSLIANSGFSGDCDRETKAAQGVLGLLADLVVSLPNGSGLPQSGATTVADGAAKGAPEDIQAAETFLASMGRNERTFARLLALAGAPCDSESGEVQAYEGSPLWSPCAFALWCLTRIRPPPARVQTLRPLLPRMAEVGPPRVRWLSGELLLHLHVIAEGSDDDRLGALVVAHERHIVEVAMADQIGHSLEQLRGNLDEDRDVILQQVELAEARQRPLALAGDGAGSSALERALQQLVDIRERLAKGTLFVRDCQSRTGDALEALCISMEAKGVDASEAEITGALESVRDAEDIFSAKQLEWADFDRAYKHQDANVEASNKEMEEADRKVNNMRKMISDIELELQAKQKEAQTQRTLASSDTEVVQSQLRAEMEKMDSRIVALREKAAALQGGSDAQSGVDPSKVAEMMDRLKQEAARCKQKRLELQEDLKKVAVDPAALEAAALKAERQAVELQEQLSSLRSSGLTDLERSHFDAREVWRQHTTKLQDIRLRRDATARERDELQRRLGEKWRLWRPMWSTRLRTWNSRSLALAKAQSCGQELRNAISSNWQMLRDEQAARRRVLETIGAVQEALAQLSQQLVDVGDLG